MDKDNYEIRGYNNDNLVYVYNNKEKISLGKIQDCESVIISYKMTREEAKKYFKDINYPIKKL